MNANYDKLTFGTTLNEIGTNGSITSSVCHNYGSVSGCDEGCPNLLGGLCENPLEAIKECDVSCEDKADILVLYNLAPKQL